MKRTFRTTRRILRAIVYTINEYSKSIKNLTIVILFLFFAICGAKVEYDEIRPQIQQYSKEEKDKIIGIARKIYNEGLASTKDIDGIEKYEITTIDMHSSRIVISDNDRRSLEVKFFNNGNEYKEKFKTNKDMLVTDIISVIVAAIICVIIVIGVLKLVEIILNSIIEGLIRVIISFKKNLKN